MKYIIEIDSKVIEDAKNGYVRLGEIADAVKTTATPYNPSGDCISREALKKELEVYRHDETRYVSDEEQAQNSLLDNILEDIDNAQAIEQNWRFYYDHGYAQAKRDFERPHGEWVEKTFENDDEEGTKSTSFVCSCCGVSRVAGLGNAKFCYNCGADMRGGAK